MNGAVDTALLTKDEIRELHRPQRVEKLAARSRLIESADEFAPYFAAGSEIVPARIQPRLELIETGSWEADLFAFASMYWSVPTSSGYGRRLRFLCWDDSVGKLMGLIALGDPVFNLRVRDDFVGWTVQDRSTQLASVMDAYVLGALPPYNMLLGGKLIASLLRTRFMADAFRDKYSDRRSIISGKRQTGKLAMITTSSSLGRSSVYNRLRLGGVDYLTRVGATRGYGHFHIPQRIFNAMRAYLNEDDHAYANGHSFGEGANWRMRVIREALTSLGLSPNLLRHGISREVYVTELASNCCAYLRGEVKTLRRPGLLSLDEVAELALQRWVIPRGERDSSFASWTFADTIAAIRGVSGDSRPGVRRNGRSDAARS
jgi:hypothetical protein